MDEQLLKKLASFQQNTPPVDIDMAKIQIWADPFMNPYDKLKATTMFNTANEIGGGTGRINGEHIAGSLLQTGFNMAGASIAGKIVGSMFGLSPESQDVLRAQGVLYAGLKGLSII